MAREPPSGDGGKRLLVPKFQHPAGRAFDDSACQLLAPKRLVRRAFVAFPAEARLATGLSSLALRPFPARHDFGLTVGPKTSGSSSINPGGRSRLEQARLVGSVLPKQPRLRGRLASGALGTSCSPPLRLAEDRRWIVEELWTGRCASRPSGSISSTLQECPGSLPSGPFGGTWNPVPASVLGMPFGRGLLVCVCSVPTHWAASPKRGGRRVGPSCPASSAEAGIAGVTSAPVCLRHAN